MLILGFAGGRLYFSFAITLCHCLHILRTPFSSHFLSVMHVLENNMKIRSSRKIKTRTETKKWCQKRTALAVRKVGCGPFQWLTL